MYEVRRLNGWRCTQMLQYEVIGLTQPELDTTQRLVVEWADTQHADTVVVYIKYLENAILNLISDKEFKKLGSVDD